MTLHTPRAWIISYDIADPRRLAQIFRYLKSEAVPVQYSVFVTECSTHHMREIKIELEKRIEPKEDDIRIYPMPKAPNVSSIGKRVAPDGVLFLANTPWLTGLLNGQL